MKVNLVNAQLAVELIIKNVEAGNKMLARSELNALRKNAYSKQRYLQQKLEREAPGGAEGQILRGMLREAQRDYAMVKANVDIVREYIKSPEEFDFKTHRKAFYSVQKAYQNLNAIEAKKAAEKQFLRAEQSRAGDVRGVTILNIRRSEKLNALLQNVIYNNAIFNFSEGELNEIAQRIYDMTGYDLNQNILNIFDTPQHYESGGGEGNIPTYDALVNITNDLMNAKSGINHETGKPFTADELNELEGYIERFNTMYE